MFVKICGLRDAASVQVAIDAGADALGFILAPSKRQVAPEEVAAIRPSLRGDVPPLVGVTVNANAGELNALVQQSGVDMVQLAGDESPEVLDSLQVPAIKALRFPAGTTPDDALREVELWLSRPHPPAHIHVEGHAAGSFGGTGTRADWDLARHIAARFPVILAGGLDPDNVVEAIGAVRPAGVDVASGTESGGVKDPEKIRAFVLRAKQANQPTSPEA